MNKGFSLIGLLTAFVVVQCIGLEKKIENQLELDNTLDLDQIDSSNNYKIELLVKTNSLNGSLNTDEKSNNKVSPNITKLKTLSQDSSERQFNGQPNVLMARIMFPECNADISLGAGETYTFATPKYPQVYPSFAHCGWNFNQKSDDVILTLECSEFNLNEQLFGCYSLLGSMRVETATNQKSFCGNNGPSTIQSSSSIRIKFWSALNFLNTGFKCTVTASASTTTTTSTTTSTTTTTTTSTTTSPTTTTTTPATTTTTPATTTTTPATTTTTTKRPIVVTVRKLCGGAQEPDEIFTADFTFTSLSYPNPYPDISCVWLFEADSNQATFELDCTDFELTPQLDAADCTQSTTDSHMLVSLNTGTQVFCDNSGPTALNVPQSDFSVTFRPDDNPSDQTGFQCTLDVS